MNEQSIFVPTQSQGGGAQRGHDPNPLEFLQKLHRLFRGRYLLAGILASLGGIAGAVGGYLLTQPTYTATGSLRIRAGQPVKLSPTELSQPLFNAYQVARDHANLLQEPRVVERAMLSAEWRALGKEVSESARDAFNSSLRVITDREQPTWIRVQFTDLDRLTARIAVEQVLAAYREIHGGTDLIVDPRTIEELTQRKRAKEAEIWQLQREITQITRAFGVADLSKAVTELGAQVAASESAVRMLQNDIAIAESRLAGVGGSAEGGQPQGVSLANSTEDLLTAAAALAPVDARVARDLDIRSQAARALEAQLIKFTDRHQSVRALRAELAASDSQLAESIRMARARSLPGMPMGIGGVSMISSEAELASARQQLDALSKQSEQTRQRLFEAQDRQVNVEQKQREIAQAQKLIDEINQRISRLNIEMGTEDTQSRIVILPRVDSPAGPTNDSRLKFAALGLMFGTAAPIGFVMLLGLLDRRVRYCEDAQDTKSRLSLLGILPYLPADLQDPEQAAVAAHCVHQIRTLLQIGGADHSRKVFAITSPTSGDGKTSLAMALGLSFAQSGARTLMLDFDLIGAGLTSAMGARSASGVLDATLHGEINGFVRPTNFPGLDIIPVGADDARDVSKLSLQLVRNLIRQAHDRYDAVVIDTGPVLGSLEASLVCAAADGSILTLGRGQQRGQAERALEHLQSIGATFLGVVFNRAEQGDFRRAVSSASVRSRPLSDEERSMRPPQGLVLPSMGPVARTVAAQLRSGQASLPGKEGPNGDNQGRG